MTNARIAVVGGGTGNHSVLAGLKRYPVDLTAIVAMSDSGGSSGRLRDELTQLPYGDVRQCLMALADEDERDGIISSLFAHRFLQEGNLEGHNFGNLVLAALTEITGEPERAIETAAKLLNIRGRVLPVTLTLTHLHAVLTDGGVLERESTIDTYGGSPGIGVDHVYLEPPASSHPPVVEALEHADLIVLSPGDLFTSLIPNLLVSGVSEAILRSSADVILICNLMTKPGETDGYSASSFVREVDRYLGRPGRIDALLVNDQAMDERLVERYAREGANPVHFDRDECVPLVATIIERPLLDGGPFLHHDPEKLGAELMEFHSRSSGRLRDRVVSS